MNNPNAEDLLTLLEADEIARPRLAVARDTLRGQQRQAFEFLKYMDKRHGLLGIVTETREVGTDSLEIEWDGGAERVAPPVPVRVDVYELYDPRISDSLPIRRRNTTTDCTLEGSTLRGLESELDDIRRGDAVFLSRGEATRLVEFAEPVLLDRHPEL